jgi:integrase
MHGSRIGDVLQLKRNQIVMIDNVMLIDYEMEKTGTDNSIVASPALMSLLLPYLSGKGPEDFVFPFLKSGLKNNGKQVESKTATINQDLKKIGAMLAKLTGTEKHLTTHVARHSFAHITRAVSGDVYATSKALKHSDVTITEGYLGQDHKALIEKVSNATYQKIEEAAQGLLKPD